MPVGRGDLTLRAQHPRPKTHAWIDPPRRRISMLRLLMVCLPLDVMRSKRSEHRRLHRQDLADAVSPPSPLELAT